MYIVDLTRFVSFVDWDLIDGKRAEQSVQATKMLIIRLNQSHNAI